MKSKIIFISNLYIYNNNYKPSLIIYSSACRYIPGLSKLLLPRINPFILIGFADFITTIGSYFLLKIGYTYIIDTYAAILISIMTISTMIPFGVYTGKILMQTTPAHMITQLDKSLREASTLDGVLEFREEVYIFIEISSSA